MQVQAVSAADLLSNEDPQLEELKINTTKSCIDDKEFERLVGVGYVEIAQGLLKIKDRAFFRSRHLVIIKLPLSLQHIEPEAFLACAKLKYVIYDGNLEYATLNSRNVTIISSHTLPRNFDLWTVNQKIFFLELKQKLDYYRTLTHKQLTELEDPLLNFPIGTILEAHEGLYANVLSELTVPCYVSQMLYQFMTTKEAIVCACQLSKEPTIFNNIGDLDRSSPSMNSVG